MPPEHFAEDAKEKQLGTLFFPFVFAAQKITNKKEKKAERLSKQSEPLQTPKEDWQDHHIPRHRNPTPAEP